MRTSPPAPTCPGVKKQVYNRARIAAQCLYSKVKEANMDESLIGIIVAAGCGLLCAGLGAYMVVTGNPSLLHSYHYATTPLVDRPGACARIGRRTHRDRSAGLRTHGAFGFFGVWAGVAGIVLLVAGIAINLISIIRHNGSLFSFPSSGEKAHGGRGLQHRPQYWRRRRPRRNHRPRLHRVRRLHDPLLAT